MKVELPRIQNNKNKHNNNPQKPSFKGPIDGAITGTLAMLDTNAMANAFYLDLGSMVLPRTYVDGKRNKYAGAETFIRELASTFVTCLSAGVFAVGITKIANKMIDKTNPINTASWYTKDGIKTLTEAWNNSNNSTEKFVTNILENTNGIDGKTNKNFKDIKWDKVEWFECDKWEKLKWKNPKYNGIQNKLKTKEGIIKTLTELIEDKTVDRKDAKNILKITETRITNAFGINRSVNVSINKKNFGTSLENLLRDTHDIGKDIFTNKNINIEKTFNKIAKINKVKAYGALALSSTIGLLSQHLNRKLTEKRTGQKGFVGTTDFSQTPQKQNTINNHKNTTIANTQKTLKTDFYKKINKDNSFTFKQNPQIKTNEQPKEKGLLAKKLLASAGIVGLALGVMKVKSPKDFARKLEFIGPVSTGNAIKTVYTATLVGRFMASADSTELRESVTRDYLGFLNWLVLGGFAAKGAANIMDKKREYLFNEANANIKPKSMLGKVKHWLGDVQLKTHAEIAAKGGDMMKKNIKKLNIAHTAGLAYSTIMLGFALPMLNVFVTNKKEKERLTNKDKKAFSN